MLKSDPDAGIQLMSGCGSKLSTAVGSVQVTRAVKLRLISLVVMFGEHDERLGASLSVLTLFGYKLKLRRY